MLCSARSREPKVHELGRTVAAKDHVLLLHVLVEHAASVTKRERGGDVDEDARDALPHRPDRARVQGTGPLVAGDGVVEALGAVDERQEHEELVALRDDAVVQRDDVRVRAELEHEQRLLAVLKLDLVALRRVKVGVPHALERAAARGAADRVVRLVHLAEAARAEELADAEERASRAGQADLVAGRELVGRARVGRAPSRSCLMENVFRFDRKRLVSGALVQTR